LRGYRDTIERLGACCKRLRDAFFEEMKHEKPV
jgi:hypothetical protein